MDQSKIVTLVVDDFTPNGGQIGGIVDFIGGLRALVFEGFNEFEVFSLEIDLVKSELFKLGIDEGLQVSFFFRGEFELTVVYFVDHFVFLLV